MRPCPGRSHVFVRADSRGKEPRLFLKYPTHPQNQNFVAQLASFSAFNCAMPVKFLAGCCFEAAFLFQFRRSFELTPSSAAALPPCRGFLEVINRGAV